MFRFLNFRYRSKFLVRRGGLLRYSAFCFLLDNVFYPYVCVRISCSVLLINFKMGYWQRRMRLLVSLLVTSKERERSSTCSHKYSSIYISCDGSGTGFQTGIVGIKPFYDFEFLKLFSHNEHLRSKLHCGVKFIKGRNYSRT